jgi:hypothetical protein
MIELGILRANVDLSHIYSKQPVNQSKIMQYINLTPHAIDVYPSNAFEGLKQSDPTTWVADSVYAEQAIAVFPSAGVARISTSTAELPHGPGDIPLVSTTYGEATGIPEGVEADDILIVSLPMLSMAQASGHPLAHQMVAPYKVVRSAANGSIVLGCMGFTK